MGFKAEIIADSICRGHRLTTFRLEYPRFIHSEIMTHRVFSRNAASSRAIPCKKLRQRVLKDPVIPVWFGETQKGMQAEKELKGWKLNVVKKIWLWSRYPMCFIHFICEKLRLHKQLTNRLIEPWMWIEVVLSGTEFKNFFKLRNHHAAQPEFKKLASMMEIEYVKSVPVEMQFGDLHLPFVRLDERMFYSEKELKIISSARCARVSYYLLDSGVMSFYEKDKETYDKLVGSEPIHSSPMEHPATAMDDNVRYGNYVGWMQHRKEIPNESGGDYSNV